MKFRVIEFWCVSCYVLTGNLWSTIADMWYHPTYESASYLYKHSIARLHVLRLHAIQLFVTINVVSWQAFGSILFLQDRKNYRLHVQSVFICTILVSVKDKFNYKMLVQMKEMGEKINYMWGRGEKMNYIQWI